MCGCLFDWGGGGDADKITFGSYYLKEQKEHRVEEYRDNKLMNYNNIAAGDENARGCRDSIE